jgi:hypothetical protein
LTCFPPCLHRLSTTFREEAEKWYAENFLPGPSLIRGWKTTDAPLNVESGTVVLQPFEVKAPRYREGEHEPANQDGVGAGNASSPTRLGAISDEEWETLRQNQIRVSQEQWSRNYDPWSISIGQKIEDMKRSTNPHYQAYDSDLEAWLDQRGRKSALK